MAAIPVIVIFDVGKTNKKLLLFDEQYRLLHEQSRPFAETTDEDGFAGEDVQALTRWLKDSFAAIRSDKRFVVKAVNFSAYGASFVNLDKEGHVCTPLYNYLKPFPDTLRNQFYKQYGGESKVAKQTASPVLGSLNSGMQLYRLKYEQPGTFAEIHTALHLPQYLSYCIGGGLHSDITSVGCHTNLWHFQHGQYHEWVKKEGVLDKLAPLQNSTEPGALLDNKIPVGIGLHDSSAALIPYLASFTEPFVLLSTGTWCISLNPFNHSLLTDHELQQDCLCYISYQGNPVKASRLFAGYEHEEQVKRLAEHYGKETGYYKIVAVNLAWVKKMRTATGGMHTLSKHAMTGTSGFSERDLHKFSGYEEAYHRLIADIMEQQERSTNLVMKETGAKRIFVDGGFSQNPVYMHMLAESYPGIEVYAATVPQSSALGAALALHAHWNSQSLPTEIIGLKLYSSIQQGQL